jgi:hypothetical protein
VRAQLSPFPEGSSCMSQGTDRRIQSNRLLLGVVMILVFIIAAGGIMLWPRQRSTDAPQQPASQDGRIGVQFRLVVPLQVILYSPSEGMLRAGTAVVQRQPDTQSQAREALIALFADQRTLSAPVLRDLKLREFYLDAAGTAYLDLIPGPQKDERASAWEEHLAIYAMVNTVLKNFDEIKQVVLLLDGRQAQTLAGHMDLSRTYTKRMDLVQQ